MPTPASSKSCVLMEQPLPGHGASGADDVSSAKTRGSKGNRNVALFVLGLSTLLLAACVVYVKQALDVVKLELQAVRQALPELSEDVSPELSEDDSVPHSKGRRLETRGNIAAYGSATSTAGCVTVDMSAATADLTLTVSGDACNSLRCPACYIISNAHTTWKLILAATSTMKMGVSGAAMGETSTAYTASLVSVLFVNADATDYQLVSDGTTTHLLAPKSHLKSYAYTGASNALYFSSNYFYNGLYTGTGYAGTGATLTGAGVLSVDGAATIAGATEFGGAITAKASSSFNVDFSASSGTFLTPTGAVTIGTGAVTISGAATLSGGTTFSADVASSGTAAIDFSGSSGLCKVANPWIVR
eukprot:TRINITY_DN32806_c0_g1_i1.p1 TRINITY_DN32806_c0_g1~~TRINITY_DN32806_c0_g1_i1.p1  ORF type:complete len:360 (+),score=54.85 TRINITY_DN32806_c0_g1_i1:53-1132(+)